MQQSIHHQPSIEHPTSLAEGRRSIGHNSSPPLLSLAVASQMSRQYQRLGDDIENTPLFGGPAAAAPPRAPRRSLLPQATTLLLIATAILGFLYQSPGQPKVAVLDEAQPPPSETSASKESGASEKFDALGRYIMRNFDQAKPMSNFLAGIGGLWGGMH